MILHLKSHLIHSRNSSKACLVASCCILRFASPIPSSWKDDMKSSGFDQFSSKAKDYRMSVHASSIKWPDGERLNENYVHFSTADLDYGQRYDALWNLQNMTLNSEIEHLDRCTWKLDIELLLIGVCGTLILPFGGSSRYVMILLRKGKNPIFFMTTLLARSLRSPLLNVIILKIGGL